MVKIKSGALKGEEMDAINPSGSLFGAECKVGMKVIVIVSSAGDTFVCIVYIMFPLIYKGVSPIVLSIVIAALATIVTLGLLGGFSGSMGVVLTVPITAAVASVFVVKLGLEK